jgi:hypothetical protein
MSSRSRMLLRLLAASLIAVICASTGADEVAERRAHAGVRLFRAILLADTDLAKKTAAPNQLLILFFYVDDARHANELAAQFAEEAKDLRGLTIATEVTNDATLAKYATRVPAGVFISQAPDKNALQSLVRYGIQHHVILYSPFEGHVESGVLGGLSVEAQVRPFVNRATLDASQIALKPFFLSVAKVYR